MCSLCIVTLAFVSACTGPQSEAAGDESPEDLAESIQAECIRYREEHVQSGHIRLHIKRERFAGEVAEIVEEENEVWFEHDRLRLDARHREIAGQDWGEWSRFVLDGERYVWIPPEMIAGVIAPRVEYPDIHGQFGAFHPRFLGMGVSSVQTLQRDESMRLVNPARDNETLDIRQEHIDGLAVYRIAFTLATGGRTRPAEGSAGVAAERSTVSDAGTSVAGASDSVNQPGRDLAGASAPVAGDDGTSPAQPEAQMPIVAPLTDDAQVVIWIAPEAGYGLLRAEVRVTPASIGPTVTTMEAKYKQYSPGGIWFPQEIIRTVDMNGARTSRESLLIDDAEFDPAATDGMFELAAMDLPKGKEILDRTQGDKERALIWDGQKSVHIPGPNEPATQAPVGAGTSLRFFLILNMIVLAVAACVVAVKLIGRQSTKQSRDATG
jgi:hypothetical protein